MAGLTAWQALFVHGGLQRGQTVVILGASGGVGTVAVQLARRAGVRVVAVAHSWARVLLGELGADEFVDATSGAPSARAPGADLLVDLVGGEAVATGARLLAPGASVVSVVGAQSPVGPAVPYRFFVVEPDRPQLMELAGAVEAGELRPVVGDVVDLDRGAEAFASKRRGGIAGKIVLRHRAPEAAPRAR
jgi:NADPH:quinone reductase-like Zn-dependent oxidoreductase